MSNFEFLRKEWNDIFQLAQEAEMYIYALPNHTCLTNRKALEKTIKWMYENDADLIKPYDTSLNALICEDSFANKIPQRLILKVNNVRQQGNKVAHEDKKLSSQVALKSTEALFEFLQWFYMYYSSEKPTTEIKFDPQIVTENAAEPLENKQASTETQNGIQKTIENTQGATEKVNFAQDTTISNNEDFESIKKLLDKGHNIFVTGEAGTGKSYILNKLKAHYKEKLDITSTTGMSAIDLNGQTINSWAGIGRGVTDEHIKNGTVNKLIEDTVYKILNKEILYAKLKSAQMLAIDEISMMNDRNFDFINEVLKRIRNNPKPFGGIRVLLFGDFFQLPPADLGKNNADFCFNSATWEDLDIKPVILKKNYRQQNDPIFINALKQIRMGNKEAENIQIFEQRETDSQNVEHDGILHIFTKNQNADAYNLKCFGQLTAESRTYDSYETLYRYDKKGVCVDEIYIDSFSYKGLDTDEQNMLKTFRNDCKAPEKLVLKIGARVMLVKNVDLNLGLANGSMGTVEKMYDDSIEVLFDNGRRYAVSRCEFVYQENSLDKIRRMQYPLRLAYGITIHKSQGMTLEKIFVDLAEVFDYGQVYVALSRAKELSGLMINNYNSKAIATNPIVVDFYKQIEKDGKYSKDKNEPYMLLKEATSVANVERIKSLVEIAKINNKVIEMKYAKKFEQEIRNIKPLDVLSGVQLRKKDPSMSWDVDKLYIDAICCKEKKRKNFRLDRILSAKIVDNTPCMSCDRYSECFEESDL